MQALKEIDFLLIYLIHESNGNRYLFMFIPQIHKIEGHSLFILALYRWFEAIVMLLSHNKLSLWHSLHLFRAWHL